jgi:AmmeMemoRadiSam system protein B
MAEHVPRPPVAAGRFYPDDAELLLLQIEACYTHPLGPYSSKAALPDRPPLALIVPHGALGHAGPVTAHAFACLDYWSRRAGVFPELVVLLGPDHLALGASVSATRRDYVTPLGCLPTHLALVDRLCAAAQGKDAMSWLTVAEAGHDREHAIENVVPFLQYQAAMFAGAWGNQPYAWNRALPELLPLTIRVQDLETAERLAALLDLVLPRDGVLLVATGDLCHCGPLYGNAPVFGETPEAFCRKGAERVTEVLRAFDPNSLFAAYHREAWSLCGITGIAAALRWARLRGGSETRLLCLADSVAIARAWNDHPSLPRDGCGALLYPWNLLTGVDSNNPVGFGSFALL